MTKHYREDIVQVDQPSLQVGDLVQIHSLGEIESTLNHSRKLKGRGLTTEMEQYCDLSQR